MSKLSLKAPENELFISAKELIKKINSHNKNAYIVGGATRDLLLNKKVKDIDIVSDCNFQELQEIFPNGKQVGAAFGIMIERVGKFDFEIASCREEREYLDGRHPEKVKFTRDFEVDSQRRDFTINALLFNPITSEVIDYHNGIDDLQKGIIRTVGEPYVRFNEDYLRMLRAVRFASNLGFELECSCAAAICELSAKTKELSHERIKRELDLMLLSKNPARAMKLLSKLGILKAVLPEVDGLNGVTQNPKFHPEGDVFEHTMVMLEHMKLPKINLAWSVLLHDVGKKITRTVDESGIHFYAHEVKSAEIAEKIMERLRFSKNSSSAIRQALLNHMRFANVPQMKEAKILKLIGDKNFALELELNRLDCISCHGLLDSFELLLDKIHSRKGIRVLPPPIVNGKMLLDLGLESGPSFSKIIKRSYDAQLSGKFTTASEAISYLKSELI